MFILFKRENVDKREPFIIKIRKLSLIFMLCFTEKNRNAILRFISLNEFRVKQKKLIQNGLAFHIFYLSSINLTLTQRTDTSF